MSTPPLLIPRWTPSLVPGRRVVWAGLLGAAATTSGLALTATSGWLIVQASTHPAILTLLVAIVGVRAFGLARPVLRYAERLRSHDAALSDLAAQRTQVYAGLVPLTPARLGRRARSEVLGGVVDDLTEVVESQARAAAPAIAAGGAAVAATALATALLPAAGIVLGCLVGAVALLGRVAWVLESRTQQRILDARADVLRVSELVGRQAGELRAIGAGDTALQWLADAQRRHAREARAQSRGRALLSALILAATGAATAATAWMAALAASRDALSDPVAVLLVLLPVAVGEALGTLPDAVRALARAQASATRLDRMFDQAPAVLDHAPPVVDQAPPVRDQPVDLELPPWRTGRPVPHLQLQGVSASWVDDGRSADGTRPAPALAALDLDLPPGHRLAVVGANGSGKSTLVAVLARHLDPADGSYTVDGHDVRDLPLARVRGLFAIVDDEPHIFATSLRENLRLAGGNDAGQHEDAALALALRQAGLGLWLDGLPEGLDTRLGTGGRGVSGGERARIGLARALLSGRPVLLLDEPVAHVDHATAAAVLADLAASSATRTVVMATHRPEGLEHFDTVLDLTAAPTSSPSWRGASP